MAANSSGKSRPFHFFPFILREFSVLETYQTVHQTSLQEEDILPKPQATFQRFEMLGNLELGIPRRAQQCSVRCTVVTQVFPNARYVQYDTFFCRQLLLSCQSFTTASVAWQQCIGPLKCQLSQHHRYKHRFLTDHSSPGTLVNTDNSHIHRLNKSCCSQNSELLDNCHNDLKLDDFMYQTFDSTLSQNIYECFTSERLPQSSRNCFSEITENQLEMVALGMSSY